MQKQLNLFFFHKTTIYDVFIFKRLQVKGKPSVDVKWGIDVACERHMTYSILWIFSFFGFFSISFSTSPFFCSISFSFLGFHSEHSLSLHPYFLLPYFKNISIESLRWRYLWGNFPFYSKFILCNFIKFLSLSLYTSQLSESIISKMKKVKNI